MPIVHPLTDGKCRGENKTKHNNRHGISSYDMEKLKKNDDGSVTLYFGPKALKRLENNWIPTEGKKPSLFVRFYGATDAFFDKTFKTPDVELVK